MVTGDTYFPPGGRVLSGPGALPHPPRDTLVSGCHRQQAAIPRLLRLPGWAGQVLPGDTARLPGVRVQGQEEGRTEFEWLE